MARDLAGGAVVAERASDRGIFRIRNGNLLNKCTNLAS